jgi:hypothetical protein
MLVAQHHVPEIRLPPVVVISLFPSTTPTVQVLSLSQATPPTMSDVMSTVHLDCFPPFRSRPTPQLLPSARLSVTPRATPFTVFRTVTSVSVDHYRTPISYPTTSAVPTVLVTPLRSVVVGTECRSLVNSPPTRPQHRLRQAPPAHLPRPLRALE